MRTLWYYILNLFATPRGFEPKQAKHDLTKITPDMIKHIRHRHAGNALIKCTFPEHSLTMVALTKELNEYFGINKSRTTYANVWNYKGAYQLTNKSE